MKTVITACFFLLLTSAAVGELTKEDVRTIIREEITASEKRAREYIDLKIEAINARFEATNAKIDATNARIDALDNKLSGRIDALEGNINRIWLAILALIAAAVALPQLIIVYSERKREKEIQMLIQQLREQVEAAKNTPS